MPREQWGEFTDFGVTEYDSAGQQVGQGAMNYALGRHSFDVPSALKDHPITIELFPAFARDDGAHPWRTTVRVRFLLREGRPFGTGADVSVVAGGRTVLPPQRPPELTPSPVAGRNVVSGSSMPQSSRPTPPSRCLRSASLPTNSGPCDASMYLAVPCSS